MEPNEQKCLKLHWILPALPPRPSHAEIPTACQVTLDVWIFQELYHVCFSTAEAADYWQTPLLPYPHPWGTYLPAIIGGHLPANSTRQGEPGIVHSLVWMKETMIHRNCSIPPEAKGPAHHAWLLFSLNEFVQEPPKASHKWTFGRPVRFMLQACLISHLDSGFKSPHLTACSELSNGSLYLQIEFQSLRWHTEPHYVHGICLELEVHRRWEVLSGMQCSVLITIQLQLLTWLAAPSPLLFFRMSSQPHGPASCWLL